MDGRVLSFNTSTAHVWGQLVASLEKKGIHIPTLDSQLSTNFCTKEEKHAIARTIDSRKNRFSSLKSMC
jgi:predicted nucleic acid-binding protein